MARAIWSGSISFGLVSIPVKAFTAVRDHGVHFHQLQKGTGARIRYKKVSESSGREVDGDKIELGYELGSGKYVTIDPDELDQLRPRTTRTIDISDFVRLDEIDPIYYERTYWLAPGDEQSKRAYSLLLAAMEDEQRVGIGSIVMRRKQYLGIIRPLDGALALSTMRFADEVVDRSDIDEVPSRRSKPAKQELELATTIVTSLASEWEPDRYRDTYTDEVRALVEAREAGKAVSPEPAAETGAEVVDLMKALQASIADARKGRRPLRGTSAKRSKKAAKRPTKRSTSSSSRKRSA